jgi:hypothetical protein
LIPSLSLNKTLNTTSEFGYCAYHGTTMIDINYW